MPALERARDDRAEPPGVNPIGCLGASILWRVVRVAFATRTLRSCANAVATLRNGDALTSPRERFVYHNAGLDGRGSSSYIDDVILRERNDSTALASSAPISLDDRLYYLQNWRHDVSVLVRHNGNIVERIKYSSYGVPRARSAGDFNADGVIDEADFALFEEQYNALLVTYGSPHAAKAGSPPVDVEAWGEYDLNVDGLIDEMDFALFGDGYSNIDGVVPGQLSHRTPISPELNIDNRIGYAGYQWSRTGFYNVRFRQLFPFIGEWDSRDPLQYIDGPNMFKYVLSSPISYVDPLGLNASYYPGEPTDCRNWRGNGKCQGDRQQSNRGSPSENKYIKRKCSKEYYPTLANPTLGDAYCWERARAVDKGYSWFDIGLAAKSAQDFAKNRYGGTGQEIQRNALQHCVYSCSLRKTFDDDQANDILDAHECATIHWDLYPAKDSFEDWKWNGQGSDCSRSGAGCAACCDQKVRNVLDPKYNTTPGAPSTP